MDIIVLITQFFVHNLYDTKKLRIEFDAIGEYVKIKYMGVCVGRIITHVEHKGKSFVVTPTMTKAFWFGDLTEEKWQRRVINMLKASLLNNGIAIAIQNAGGQRAVDDLLNSSTEIVLGQATFDRLSQDEIIDLCNLQNPYLLTRLARVLNKPHLTESLELFRVYKELFIDKQEDYGIQQSEIEETTSSALG